VEIKRRDSPNKIATKIPTLTVVRKAVLDLLNFLTK